MGTLYRNYNKYGRGGVITNPIISHTITETSNQYGYFAIKDIHGEILDPDKYEILAVDLIVNNNPWKGAWNLEWFIDVGENSKIYSMIMTDISGNGSSITYSTTQTYRVTYISRNNIGMSEHGHTYSTDEQIVGKWIDGKPVYEKTIENVSITRSGNWTNFLYTNDFISSIDTLIDMDIRAIGRGTLGIPANLILKPVVAYVETTAEGQDGIQTQINAGDLSLSDISTTLQYTKTTD